MNDEIIKYFEILGFGILGVTALDSDQVLKVKQ